jgi:hypothetical protein
MSKCSSVGLATVLHQHISLLSDHQRSLAAVLAAELEASVTNSAPHSSTHKFSQEGWFLCLVPSCRSFPVLCAVTNSLGSA